MTFVALQNVLQKYFANLCHTRTSYAQLNLAVYGYNIDHAMNSCEYVIIQYRKLLI